MEPTNTGRVAAYLSPPQAAAHLGITVLRLVALRRAGKGPHYTRLGHRTILYLRRDLDEWLDALRTDPALGLEQSRVQWKART